MNITDSYNTSFRCFFDNDGDLHYTTHYVPQFPVADIPRWIDAYVFTHPNCTSMSCKVWFSEMPTPPESRIDDMD